MGTMAQLNGYRLLLGIDELEKAERTHEHFEAIVEFVDSLPKNTSLFITGTPELVEGGTEGNAFQESHRELYELTVDNRIVLESPSENDLRAFTDKLLDLEKMFTGSTARVLERHRHVWEFYSSRRTVCSRTATHIPWVS